MHYKIRDKEKWKKGKKEMYTYVGTSVWNLLFTGIRPKLSFLIPTLSNPKLCVYGLLPTQIRNVLQEIFSFLLESFMFSTETTMSFPVLFAEVTFVSILNFMPCLVKIFLNIWLTSLSIVGPPIVDEESIAVTSEPNLIIKRIKKELKEIKNNN